LIAVLALALTIMITAFTNKSIGASNTSLRLSVGALKMDDDWSNGLGVPTTVVASDTAVPSVFKKEKEKENSII